MSDNNIKPVRVLHLVSSEGVTGAAQQALFMPMLTRMPKARAKMLVVALSPDVVPGAVLRQNGVPVYDVALSQRRFSLAAFGQLREAVRSFRPDVIQAWGHTAQIVAHWLRGRCDWDTKVVWSVANTAPLPRKPGLIDREKLKRAAKLARRADRIVYTSEAAASAHRRVGFPEEGYAVVPLGVDPTRFKPDPAMRRKIRERLGIEPGAFVIGMLAPFQPEYDYPTLLKATGELIKTNPNVSLLLAGHGVQKGNAPLMALVGGGTLGTRTQLLGEWSDVAAFFNACDLACSSALTDSGRMSLVMAMLCGIPCVATGMGAQGEVIGQFGVAVEPGNPTALLRGFTRILQLPQDKRAHMAQGARKHALTNFVSIRSLQKYLQLYYDLVGRTLMAATSVPAPKIDVSIPPPAPVEKAAEVAKPPADRSVEMHELADPDSLESRGAPVPEPARPSEGDVLQMFETALATQAPAQRSAMSERARGVAEELGDLLSPEMLQADAGAKPSPPVASAAPATLAAAAPVAPQPASNEELSLAETTLDLAAKVQLEATGSFELAADLIFTPAPAPKASSSVPAAATQSVVGERARMADSATVPALAVDALLSATEPTGAQDAAPEALQLDLLAAGPEQVQTDAPPEPEQTTLPLDLKLATS